MKVLDVYSKKDLDILTCHGRKISEIMESFFSKFPKSYRVNYDRNLSNLMIWKVDEDYDDVETSQYIPTHNLITFENIDTIIHELIHMASANRLTGNMAFVKDMNDMLYECALVEGMTEYLSCMAIGNLPYNYYFEYFVISMLSSIDGIFEPFFIPNHDKFISLFKNRKDIYSLMYSLDYYHDNICDVDINSENDIVKLQNSVKSTIDTLIDIELSFDKTLKEKQEYADKFMTLISMDDIRAFIFDICPKYREYAFKEVKKRVLGR